VLTPGIRRGDADACPGALRLHAAADGPLARVRLPGGLLTGGQLRAMRELAEEFGDGHIELTSRANLQLRALTSAPAEVLETRLTAAGLLPSATHELVRNIAASPLSTAEGAAEVRRLDEALCADDRLADLPGRFLFALDSGALDVARSADVATVPATALAVAGQDKDDQFLAYGEVAVLFAGVDAGLRVAGGQSVRALLAGAHAFLSEREAQRGSDRVAWRVRELVDGPVRVAGRVAAALGVRLRGGGAVPEPGIREPVGVIGSAAGLVALGAAVPLGRVSGVQMKVLEEAAAIVVTPWRGVVLPDLSPAAAREWQLALAEVGFEVESGSRWSGVTACAGRPGCAKSLADVRGDAAAVVAQGQTGVLPVHWVGCARGCGSPAGPHVRVEATAAGYEVRAGGSSGFAAADEVGALVAAARRG
jgi:precorrin-3B synthase